MPDRVSRWSLTSERLRLPRYSSRLGNVKTVLRRSVEIVAVETFLESAVGHNSASPPWQRLDWLQDFPLDRVLALTQNRHMAGRLLFFFFFMSRKADDSDDRRGLVNHASSSLLTEILRSRFTKLQTVFCGSTRFGGSRLSD